MLKTYFVTAWRNLIRNKVYSTLNILGLTAGMAVALLIGLWVYDQLSYDQFFPGNELVYQVKYNLNDHGSIQTQNAVSLPLGEALTDDISEVAYVTPFFGPISNRLTVGEKNLYPTGCNAGPDFLKIFRYPLLKGNPEEAMKNINSIVLSESMAKSLFGNTDVIGKVVHIDGNDPRMVTAIFKDLPAHSSFHFDYITLFTYTPGSWVAAARTSWNRDFFQLYLALKPNTSYAQAEARMKMLVKKYAPATYATTHEEVTIQPMKDWRLYTEYRNGKAVGGLIDYIRLFSITGIFVLLIACINFMNLSTARSGKRAREVGVRKVIGGTRKGLVLQFLIESLVLTFFAFAFSLLLVQLLLPAFNRLTHTHIELPFGRPGFWAIMGTYVILTGLLAGSRPALYLSSFQPVKVLKGAMKVGQSAKNFGGAASPRSFLVRNLRFPRLGRKTLVVIQFTCSIALIISTVVVYQQIRFTQSRPTGYDANRLVVTDAGYYHYNALKQAVLASGLVSSMTRSTAEVTNISALNVIDDWPGRLPNEPLSLLFNAVADTDYFKTLAIPLIAGNNFVGNFGVDSFSVILNEAAVRRMRLKDPVGQTITWSAANTPPHLKIIGVVKDVLTKSPFTAAEPAMFVYQPGATFALTYRLAPTVNTQVAMEKLKTIFLANDAAQPFDYHFVSDKYASQFELELLIGKLSGIFAALAIFISCLGLFGLAAYTAEQRTKEVGIRKVLGATVSQVWVLLSKDFIVLVGISCLIASPIAFYFLHQWLQGYYYRVSIGAGVFVFSALAALGITLMTISFQALKAALMNPIKSLRTE
jgi:ABC-type antimicrobial peptide transport system permease subunit